MDPVSLSLMALSACSVAVRRIDAASRADAPRVPAAPAPGGPVRALVLDALSQTALRRVSDPALSGVLPRMLGLRAPHHGLTHVADVRLDECLEPAGPERPILARAMAERRVDAVLCDPEGMPLLAVDLPAPGEDAPEDPIRDHCLAQAGLPRLVLPEDCVWHEALTRLEAIFLPRPQLLTA